MFVGVEGIKIFVFQEVKELGFSSSLSSSSLLGVFISTHIQINVVKGTLKHQQSWSWKSMWFGDAHVIETGNCLWSRGFSNTSNTSHYITVCLPNNILSLSRTSVLCFVPPSHSLWTDRNTAVGPLIKADWGLSTVSPCVQQRHSVWDYHTCGSGINPSRDMGTRDKGAPTVQCRKGGGATM